MQKPGIPQDEEVRLKTLRSLNILDTPAEERFDRLTRLAKRIFDVPIAVLSLLDENRQWFKSCVGLDVHETSRDISFCGHTILGNEILLVPDATKDERFANNPLVVNEPGIRFYAGCPLRYLDGSKLGTLCIIDTKPRSLSNEDMSALKDLAELAERELAGIQLATLDDLTKISNRRGFMLLAQNSLIMCARHKIPASLVFFDLNRFKLINDQFGHAEGDKVLAVFAEQMRKTFRHSDVFARLGGDEFVVLLSNASIKTAEDAMERFRRSLVVYKEAAGLEYDISFSGGIVAVEHDRRLSIDDLLRRADILMYEKKRELCEMA